MIRVVLSIQEMDEALGEGRRRQIENVEIGRVDAYGAEASEGMKLHELGALGERAAAKGLGVEWTGKGTFRGIDVEGFEIRTVPSMRRDLILHREDHDDRRYLLVAKCHEPNLFCLRGWILGYSGKREEWWGNHFHKDSPRPHFAVPIRELTDINRTPAADLADYVKPEPPPRARICLCGCRLNQHRSPEDGKAGACNYCVSKKPCRVYRPSLVLEPLRPGSTPAATALSAG